jgi:predicted alpha/beta hydrolase family esterase
VQDESIYGRIDEIPIVFEDEYVSQIPEAIVPSKNIYESIELEASIVTIADITSLDSKTEERKQVSKSASNSGKFFVLVHGFQATSYDMRSIRNHLSLRFPDAQFLCSMENESNTNGDIAEMGTKLACEVVKYIKRYYADIETLERIIFIGHSLGGVIIRTALPLLSDYKDKMYSLITFSSPHLGCYYQSSTIVNAGLWLLQKWNGSQCLSQLSLQDAADPQDCFMYQLCEKPGLEWFKNVALISSYQDSYVPYESTKFELAKQALTDTK